MKVARVHGAGRLSLHEEPIPTPGPGEALVRVTCVGICGSDVHWWREGRIGSDRIGTPLVLGHECAGVIEGGPEAGSGLQSTRRVVADGASSARREIRICVRHCALPGMRRRTALFASTSPGRSIAFFRSPIRCPSWRALCSNRLAWPCTRSTALR